MDFEFIAINREGKRERAFMSADSAAALADSIRTLGGKPLSITPVRKEPWLAIFDSKRISIKEKVVFTRQLGAILSAGVLLSSCLETIAVDLENKYFSGVLQAVLFRIRGGENFSSALARYPQIFSAYYVAVTRSGEEIGTLGKTMVVLASYMEDAEAMRQKFMAAIRYPLFLMCFVFCIVSGIVVFLIPKFETIFEGAGLKLPLITQIVVDLSQFVLGHGWLIVTGFAVAGLGAWKAMQVFKVRFMVDYMVLRVPAVGKILRKAVFARFCQTTAMLLEGGVGLIRALDLGMEVTGNLFLKQMIAEVRRDVTAGAALSEALWAREDIPRVLVKMVAVGEKSASMPDMLKRMGKYYEEEVDAFLGSINSLLEPIFIVIIGAVVTIVAVALYLPIFKLSSGAH